MDNDPTLMGVGGDGEGPQDLPTPLVETPDNESPAVVGFRE